MDEIAAKLYVAIDEILRSVSKLKTYSGTTLTPGERRVMDNNFRLIEQRGAEAMRMYVDARVQESSTNLVESEKKG